jgi:hypothetical protein
MRITVSIIPREIEDSQRLVTTRAKTEESTALKKSSIKLKIEDRKKAVVATSNRLINFKSVFISRSLLNNSEFDLLGITENTANKNAVAIEENDNDADIMSV